MGLVQESFILGLLNPEDGGITLRNTGNFLPANKGVHIP